MMGKNAVTEVPKAAHTEDDELPEGWLTGSLLDLCELIRGVSYEKGEAKTSPAAGLVPILRANNIGDGHLVFDDLQFVPRGRVSDVQQLRRGDVVIAMSSGSKRVVGKAATLQDEWSGGFGAFCGVLRPTKHINSQYFGYWFQTLAYRNYISNVAAGVNINNIKREHFAALSLPIPPLAEQKRIVAKVEALLTRVNKARERLDRVPNILKKFRQSVLAAACSGRLTADWREENVDADASEKLLQQIAKRRKEIWEYSIRSKGRNAMAAKYPLAARPNEEFPMDIPESWCIASMDSLTSMITSGSRDWKQYYRENGPGTFIMAQNIRPMHFDSSYRHGVDPPDDNRDRERSEVSLGDLLVTIVGANTGDVCRIPRELEQHYVCQSVALMRPVMEETSEFLELALNSPSHGQGQYGEWIYGEGRPHLSFDHLKATAVPLPSLPEQKEIVRRVRSLLDAECRVTEQIRAGSIRGERITQAVLAKAFAGELVETEADLARREGREYESAKDLLARIGGTQRETVGKCRKSRRKEAT